MEYLLIAKVDQAYGKDGYVRIESFSDFPGRFFKLKKVYLDFWGDKKTFYVEDVKDINGKIVIKFRKFDNLRDTQVLINRDLYVDESDSVKLSDNEYYVHDLIGSEVIVENEIIGYVSDVMKSKSNDILVINGPDKKEKLIPFVLKFIEKIDLQEKKIILNISKEFLQDDED